MTDRLPDDALFYATEDLLLGREYESMAVDLKGLLGGGGGGTGPAVLFTMHGKWNKRDEEGTLTVAQSVPDTILFAAALLHSAAIAAPPQAQGWLLGVRDNLTEVGQRWDDVAPRDDSSEEATDA